ncbi:MAG: DUF721 domain-containing protein, partial [Gemmobacter sp.]
RGFEPAGRLVQGRIQKVGEKRGFAAARVLTHWDEIAGAELAAITRPVKVGYGRESFGATLTILVAPAHAPLVDMARERLRARVNAAYGYNAIGRIVITQTSAHGFAEAQAAFAPAKAAAPRRAPEPVPPAVDGVCDEGLRAALERLARNVAARRAATE